jgi:hypothetical protein
MENVILLSIGVGAFFLSMLVIEPYRFLPEMKAKKKTVGSTYWGAYDGCPVEESVEMRTIEIKKPARRGKYIVGSGTYALGRGVKMSGRG